MSDTVKILTNSPYPGLRPFREHESNLFFGREKQVEDMLAKLEDHCFLAVVGTSGCGKSSLVRAGLVPAMKQGFLMGAGASWRVAKMQPGNSPFSRLVGALLEKSALGRERGEDPNATAYLMATLRRGPLGLVETVQESHLTPETNLVVLVDQFEEIFRFREQTKDAADDATAFVNLLLAASDPSVVSKKLDENVRIFVVITMRSDFIGECALFSGLPEAINDSQFLTPRLTRAQYRAAIVEPARVFGGDLEQNLVNHLLNDMGGSRDQLPLLQHVLMRMWTSVEPSDQAEGKQLTVENYEAVGGLSKALSEHCDEVLEELNGKRQSIAESMFRCLCERGSDQRDTRRPTRVREIKAATDACLEELGQVADAFRAPGRTFLMPPIDDPLDDDTVLDISHESLIRQWGKLNSWVSAEAKSAEIYTRLEREARSWAESGKQPGALWRTPNLDMALQWMADEEPTEAWTLRYGKDFQIVREFLSSSKKQQQETLRQIAPEVWSTLKKSNKSLNLIDRYIPKLTSFFLFSLVTLFIVLLIVLFLTRETINPILGFGLIVIAGLFFGIFTFIALNCQNLAIRLHHMRKVEEQLKNALREKVFKEQLEHGFDVFMCHNSDDKSIIKNIGLQLIERGLRPWLDEWEIRPGLPWQRLLEQKIDNIRAAAVFVGPSGTGPWQQMELEAFLRDFIKRGCPVIPVILPGVSQPPQLPTILQGMTWVDFRNKEPDPLERLIWGVTGKRSGI